MTPPPPTGEGTPGAPVPHDAPDRVAPRRSVHGSLRALLVRAGVSLALLALLAWWLDPAAVAAHMRTLRPGWVAAALGLSVLQVAASAWRWRFTAARLGLRLPFREALREYYLASFLNQVLPGGVLGDVSRAWRHARTATERARRHRDPGGSSVRAVVLERASGQAVVGATAVASFLFLPLPLGTEGRLAVLGGLVAAGALVLALILRGRHALPSRRSLSGRIWRDSWRALLAPRALPVQLASSLLVVGSYLAVYVAAARAVGITTPTATLLPMVAPVLMAMLVPMTVAGWGAREGAAAALWAAVGLPGAEGVAISVAYGLLVLVSTLPGGVVLLGILLGARRGRRDPEVELEEDVVAQREGAAGRA